MPSLDKKTLEKINSLNLPQDILSKITAIICYSNKTNVREFTDKIIAEISFAGKVALIPQEKLEYLKSNIKAMTKIELDEDASTTNI